MRPSNGPALPPRPSPPPPPRSSPRSSPSGHKCPLSDRPLLGQRERM
ncbi:hypothetical protein GJR88_00460 [Dietzia sp. DQ12-45-1b]|nr:hypothetical protein GJR88_00460 [Dietzia sp. DQ12-45-1b]